MNTLSYPKSRNRPLLLAAIAGWLPVVIMMMAWPDAPALAQDVDGQVQRVFANLPAETTSQRAQLTRALSELDVRAIERLCGMIVDPGTGDDTKPRLALHALAILAANPDTPQVGGRFNQGVADGLRANASKKVKTFLIRQLQVGGGADAVPALRSVLGDETLANPAVQALVTIGGDEAKAALRESLPTAPPVSQVAILGGIESLRDRAAHAELIALSESDDQGVRRAALRALAATAGLPTAELLDALFSPDDSWYRQMESMALLIEGYSNMAGTTGDPAEIKSRMAQAFRRILNSGSEAELVHVRTAALHGLTEALGAEAVNDVIAALISNNLEFRSSAEQIAAALPGEAVTTAYVDKLEDVSTSARAGIVRVLGNRGDETALPAVLGALKDPKGEVRLAAIEASAKLGGEDAIAPLINTMRSNQAEEREAAKDALVRMAGPTVSAKIARAVPGASFLVQAALLEALADRRAADQLEVIRAQTISAAATVRIAAINAVGRLDDESAAPKLLELLASSTHPKEREALEAALGATCNRAQGYASRAAPILAAVDPQKEQDYLSLLRVLGRIGGGDALQVVGDATRDSREDVRETAYRAFSEWPDPAAAEAVLEIARDAKELTHHVLAMRAFARLVSLDEDRPAYRMLAMYDAGMQSTRRSDEKKLLLSKIGSVPSPQALRVLDRYLSDEALQVEAASAMISVSEAVIPASWVDARVAMNKVLTATDSENLQRRARRVMRRLARFEDYITDWEVAGPFAEAGRRGNELFDVVFPPERSTAAGIEWKTQPTTDDPGRYWMMDLASSLRADYAVAYLRTNIYSPAEQPARLEVGSDDGIKVWLNGEVVHSNNALRSISMGEDRIEITLSEGFNTLLLKVTNNGGGWAACARVRSTEGRSLEGVYAKSRREP